MVMINRATKEVTIKVVYYGPGLCGKTTNLEYIYDKAVPEKKGKLLTVATETDRTLFFDFLPMELGTIRGMKLRVQLYTVPGQVFYDATRRLVLRGSDGVVFVADSQAMMMEANVESLNNLKKNLQLNSLDPETVPLVFQYNKQDLNGVAPHEELEAQLNWRKVPSFPSVATVGKGVNETLKKIIELVIRRLHEQDDLLKGPQKAMAAAGAPPPAPPPVVAAPPLPARPAAAPPSPPPAPAAPPEEATIEMEMEAVPGPAPAPAKEEAPAPLPEAELEPIAEVAPPAEEIPTEIHTVETEEVAPAQLAGSAAVPLVPEREFSTSLAIVAEALEELEKRADAMAREIHELRATVAEAIEKARG